MKFDFLKLKEAKGIDSQNYDDAATSMLHAKIINEKLFLKKIYIDFYNQQKKIIGKIEDKVIVEFGSGGGFIKDVIPNAITSDLISIPNIDMCFSGLNIPFKKKSVDAVIMIDVLHHIPDVFRFLKEISRCLKVNGKVVMIEPANTLWSRFIFKNFHPEPFDPSGGWNLETKGRLTSANAALPWIVFERDRKRFEREFPSLKINKLKPHTPFRLLASGGVTMKQLVPSFFYEIINGLEFVLTPFNQYLGIFLTVELQKTG